MPAKPAKPAGKQSKAAKKAEEAARKAEEERLAALMENERLERERFEREEEAKRLAEEKRLWLEQEGRRLDDEKIDLEPLFSDRGRDMIAEQKKMSDLEDWEGFMQCNHLPDIRREAELATYIALWRENSEADLGKVFTEAQQAIDVTFGLESIVSEALANKDEKTIEHYRTLIKRIRELTAQKIDFATSQILEQLEKHINKKENSCQLSMSRKAIKMGLWVNVAKNLRLKQIEYPDLGIVTDIPRPIILQTVAVRVLHFRRDPLSPFEMGEFFTIGGVLNIEIVEVPERPKIVKARVPDVKDAGSWAILRISEKSGSLSKQQYPAVDPLTGQLQQVPPMLVHYTLPSDILLSEKVVPRIGRWNPEKGAWDEEGINDVSIEHKESGDRVLSFQTLHLTAIAVLQSRWACFPYKNWFLQPTAINTASLTVELAGDLTVKFEIGSTGCTLIKPRDEALRPLFEKPLPAMLFLQRLVYHGLNLIPSDQDAKLASTERMDLTSCLKDRALEERAALGASMMAAAFAISYSKFNATLGSKEIAVRFAKSMDFQTKQGDAGFRTILFRDTEDICYCCAIDPAAEDAAYSEPGAILTKDGLNLSPPTVGLETRFYPLTIFREITEESPILRCEESSPSFTENVRIVMESLRLFSFVEPPLPARSAEADGEETLVLGYNDLDPSGGGLDPPPTGEAGLGGIGPMTDGHQADGSELA